MIVVSGEIGGQPLDAGGDFQKAISEAVSLRFGNGHVAAIAGYPFGSAAFFLQLDWCSERFHGGKIT
jgi:hypothetical protein